MQALLAALLFLGLMLVLGPWWQVHQFNADEGINLAKSSLVAGGYNLYEDIWSDQPPFLTLVLARVQDFFGRDVAAARGVILAFGFSLVISLFLVVRNTGSLMAAWLAVAALLTSEMFLRYSVAVLIGLPAIAMGFGCCFSRD